MTDKVMAVGSSSGTWRGEGSRAAVRLCLRFLILTAARSGEARGARWSEIDLVKRTWTLPGERMKAGKEHRVPLSPQAVVVLERFRQLRSALPAAISLPALWPFRDPIWTFVLDILTWIVSWPFWLLPSFPA